MDIVIREMKEEEWPLLQDFLYDAIYLPEGVQAPPRNIIELPELQVYIKDFGKYPDDWAFVAEIEGVIVGALWVRIMNDYGHIEERTPSMAMSLQKEYRNLGIGTVLLEKALAILQTKGYSSISLSVQKTNYAKHMYENAGFYIVDENEEEYIMVNQL